MVAPIVNPEIPYNGEIPDGLTPGKMIRIQGVTHPDADRFNINLQTGPEAKPRDDTALHISVRLNQGYVARNTYLDGVWGDEEGKGSLPIGQAQSFEIIVLIDPSHFKVAVNGQHFCEFSHKIPFEKVTHLLIDGQVSITLISYEGAADAISQAARTSELNAEGPQVPQQYGPGGYGPPPGNYGPPQQGYGPPPYAGGYGPPPPPGAQQESGFNSFLSQAQGVLAGAISSAAAEKILGGLLSGSGSNQQPQGYAHQNAQYGQYPHPQGQEQRGPMESLLSGFLGGGSNQQQPHVPQVGGEGSVGGLGSMGSILSSLAGQILQNPRDGNQRPNY